MWFLWNTLKESKSCDRGETTLNWMRVIMQHSHNYHHRALLNTTPHRLSKERAEDTFDTVKFRFSFQILKSNFSCICFFFKYTSNTDIERFPDLWQVLLIWIHILNKWATSNLTSWKPYTITFFTGDLSIYLQDQIKKLNHVSGEGGCNYFFGIIPPVFLKTQTLRGESYNVLKGRNQLQLRDYFFW